MSIEVSEVERATVPCDVCGAKVNELRRGRCWGCYTQWADMRPVGQGAACTVCHERRRDNLRLVEFQGRSVPFCHGCAVRAMRLSPMPASLHGLRAALRRERRREDRREDALDGRIFPRERRASDRRAGGRPGDAAGIGALALPVDALEVEVEVEVSDRDIEVLETTVVKQNPLG